MSRGKKNKDRAAVWTCSVQSCQSTGFFLGGGKRGGLELVVLLALIVKGTALGAALVQLGDDWGGNVLDLLLGRLEVVSVGIVVLREPLDLLLNSLLDGGLVVVAELAAKLLVIVELVAGLDALLEQAVLLGVLLCLVDHALNVLWGEAVLVVGDGDGFLGARALVLCRDAEDAVDVNLKGDFNLGHAAWRGRDVVEVKLAQEVVVLCHGALALKDLDGDGGLVVCGGGEDLGLLCGDNRVALNELGHDATDGLDTEGEGVDVEEHKVARLLLAREDTALDSGAVGDGLVRVDAAAGLLAVKVLLDKLLDLGDAGGATDEDNLVNLVLAEVGILHDTLDGLEGGAEEVVVELLEAGAGECLGKVLALKEGLNLDASLVLGAEGALGLLDLAAELLHGAAVLANVLAVLLLVQLDKVVHDALVKVLTAKVGVTVCGQDLKDAVVDGEEGDIKGAATKVKDEDVLLALLLVEAVGDGGGGGLVDDAHNVEAGDGASVLCGLALGVVEVGWDGDDGVGDLLAQVGLCDLLHLGEDHGGDLLWLELLLAVLCGDLDGGLVVAVDEGKGEELLVALDGGVGPCAANEALCVKDGVLRV